MKLKFLIGWPEDGTIILDYLGKSNVIIRIYKLEERVRESES